MFRIILLLITASVIPHRIYSQQLTVSISGPTSVNVNQTFTYQAQFKNSSGNIVNPPAGGTVYWGVSKGNLISQNDLFGQIQWTTGGAGYIWFEYVTADNYYAGELPVQIAMPALPDPVATYQIVNSCGSSTVTRTNSPPNGANYDWWWQTSATGTSLSYGNGASLTLNTTVDLYLRSRSKTSPYTWGEGYQRIGLIDVGSSIPASPTIANNASVFVGGSCAISVEQVSGATSYRWYTSSNVILQGQTNRQLSLTDVIQNNTYYVSAVKGVCESAAKLPVSVNIIPNPVISTQGGTPAKLEPNGSVTLTVSGQYDSYIWYNDDDEIVGTNPIYTASLIGNYRVSVSRTGVIGTGMSNSIYVWSGFIGVDANYIVGNSIKHAGVTSIADINSFSVSSDIIQTVQYVDGLGRPYQTIKTRNSPSGKDLVQPFSYDEYNREIYIYLPYTSSSNYGELKPDALGANGEPGEAMDNFYNSDPRIAKTEHPFSKTVYEASPLSRVIKSGLAGSAWQPMEENDHTTKHLFKGNSENEVILFQFDIDNNVLNYIENGSYKYYQKNKLNVTTTYDENNHEVIVYKDVNDLTVLKKSYLQGAGSSRMYALTYYVYDDFGNLRLVLQPELCKKLYNNYVITSNDLAAYAFQYKYDLRQRLVEKKNPSTESVYFVYDQKNRVVLTQDGNQRANNLWTFTKYDELNRAIATGIKDTTAGLTLAEMQLGVANHYAKSWAKYGETYISTADKNVHGYSNLSYPTVTTAKTIDPNRYLTVTYYDNYTFKNQYGGSYDYVNDDLTETVSGYLYKQSSTEFKSVIGQVTGTKVKVLDGGITGGYTWLKSVNYYDDKYRVIQIMSDNYKSGTDRVSNLYNFVGEVLKTKALHIESDVQWTELTLTTVIGNYLKRTDPSSAWTAGAASVQSLPAGQDGWIEFVASEENTSRMIGLSSQNSGVHYNTIGYAVHLSAIKTLVIYENGTLRKQVGSYAAGDVFRIARVGTAIKYYQNGVEIYPAGASVAQTASTSSLIVDVSLFTAASTAVGVKSSFSTSSHTILRRYVYDHAGRLMKTFHTLDGGPEVLLASNEYNELGQLIDKGLHSVNGSAPMQSVDYRYNIRGWLTSLNNSQLSSDGQTNDDAGDFFGMNLAYNEELGTGNTQSTFTNTGLVSSYTFSGNASDAVANGLNGTVYGAQLTTDSQGNSNSAYNFTANDYIDIPNSKDRHSFIQNTGIFTISAFVKIDDLNARNVIVSSTSTSLAKGFTLMYETYGGIYGDHQLRFSATNGQSGSVVIALGGVRTINDSNWHHIAAVGDGKYVTLYVDGVQDGSPTPITIFASGSATSTTLIGKTRSNTNTLSLGMVGAIDELNIFNRPLGKSEISALAKRLPFNTTLDDGQYNGNISAMKWSVNQGIGNTKEMAYNFKYDALNRLTSADNLQSSSLGVWSNGKYHERDLTYDLNGNIKSLTRSSELGMIDNLVYSYGSGTTQSNKLLSVTDRTTDAVVKLKGFADSNTSGNDYTYDVNGNMTVDLNKGLSSPITYNYLNLPEVVARGGNTVRYIYDAAGRKLSQIVGGGFGLKKTDYAGEFVYEEDMLRFINHEEGRIVMSSEKLLYKHDGETLDGMTALNSTLSVVTVNGEKYVNATSSGTGSGILPIGSAINVVPGEKYLIRIKGYRSTYNAGIMIRRNNATISYGSYLPTPVSNEAWIEQVYVVPPNTNILEIGVGWSIPTGSAGLNVNAFELIKLESAAPEYQYNLKDHLGNVRLTFTSKIEEDIYTATFEDNTQSDEANNFKNYSRLTSDMFDHTDAGTVYSKAQMLNGSSGSQVGLAKTFSVMPGDVIKAEVYAKYLGAEGGPVDLSTFGAALLSAFNLSAPLAGETGTARAALQEYGAFIAGNGNPGNEDSPKGWLNILFFDRNHNLIDLAFEQLSSSSMQEIGSSVKAPHQLLTSEVLITEPGYVYVYVSNEGTIGQEIYFDDFKFTHTKSPVIQSNEYYPFGLAFNSASRENTTIDVYAFSGKEQQDELGLGWLDFGARMYVAELGRWGTVDPLAETMESFSPYGFAYNNPVTLVDIMGLAPVYNWDTGEYEDVGRNGKKKKITADQALKSVNREKGNNVIVFRQWDLNKGGDKAMETMLAAALETEASIITANNSKEAADKLEGLVSRTGKKINTLTFAGHGNEDLAMTFLGNTGYSADDVGISNIRNDANLARIGALLGKDSQVLLFNCHAGGIANGGVELCKEMALKMKTTVIANQSWGWTTPNMFNGSYQKFSGNPLIHPDDRANCGRHPNAVLGNGKFTKVTVKNGVAKVTTVYDLRYTKSGGVEYSTTKSKTP